MMMAKLILTMNLLLMDNKAPDLIVAMILSLTLTILMILTMNMNMRMKNSYIVWEHFLAKSKRYWAESQRVRWKYEIK